ncbi:uncharacterized protein BJX67DRAFT_371069 [Aspergillus lucknowensis]|uniref:Amino acid permease/ SLC12A domain-containing protein n=1 Tax=Aspergillus lucknowensis TaxID=176173 RepID=A0ABR4LXC0_9EURO
MSDPQELFDWAPEWLQVVPARARSESHNERQLESSIPLPSPDRVGGSLPRTPLSQSTEVNHEGEDELIPPKLTTIIVTPSPNRRVRRKLRGIHLFMITVNGTLGIGLYWRGGQILELAGPLAAVLAFLFVGLLCWAVMQCITEMLCIWPIPGALSLYVAEFVDAELGIAVGIAYWFSYSVGFGALLATLAAEADFWTGAAGNKAIDGGIIYLLIPAILIAINALRVEPTVLVAINVGAGRKDYMGTEYWSSPTMFDSDAADTWGIAFLMCLSVATYAYMGVEIVAASALESASTTKGARELSDESASNTAEDSSGTLVGSTVKFSAKYITLLATLAYSITGLLVSLDMPWNHCLLPRLSWINGTPDSGCSLYLARTPANTTSAMVAIAIESDIPHLGDIFNVFLVFTCSSCAGTNLYVASRSLFGLTSRLDGGRGQPWHLRLLAWFGRTNRHGVPIRAMIFSALAFIWVPYLQLRDGTGTETSVGMFIEILSQMSSVAVIIVWACEVVAFIRYYHCIRRHKEDLERLRIRQVSRWGNNFDDGYPYRSHGQPVLAYIALAGCLFILIVANGAFLWKGFHKLPFLSAYLFILVFLALWIILKLIRGARWHIVDLSNPDKVARKLRNLHDIRLAAA